MTRALAIPAGVDRPLDELALATHRLDQIDLGVGQGDSQNKARKPSSRANIRDCRGLAQVRELEPGEAVGNMDLPGAPRIGNGADRRPLHLQKLQDTRDRRPLRLVEAAPR